MVLGVMKDERRAEDILLSLVKDDEFYGER